MYSNVTNGLFKVGVWKKHLLIMGRIFQSIRHEVGDRSKIDFGKRNRTEFRPCRKYTQNCLESSYAGRQQGHNLTRLLMSIKSGKYSLD